MFSFFDNKERQLVVNGSAPMTLVKKETVLDASLKAGLNVPHSCRVGGCGTCKCRVIEGKVKEFTDSSYLLTKQELQEGYVLACQSALKSDNVVVDFPGWNLDSKSVLGSVKAITELTHDIFEVTVSLNEKIEFNAGQYIKLAPSSGGIPARCYSFSHAPCADGDTEVSFFIRQVPNGKLSNWVTQNIAIDEAIIADGPMGDFFLRDSATPVVCIAGGSGLAPILSVLEGALASHAAITKQPVQIFLGVRQQRDLYGQQRIQAIAEKWHAEVEFIPVLSAEPDDSDWQGKRGMVTDHLPEQFANGTHAYLCGPPPMLDAAMDELVKKNVDMGDIYFDKFSDQSTADS